MSKRRNGAPPRPGELLPILREDVDNAHFGCRTFAELQERLAKIAPDELADRILPVAVATTCREERLAVLAERAAAGIELFHPGDSTRLPPLQRRGREA
jgi:hypothetical protein